MKKLKLVICLMTVFLTFLMLSAPLDVSAADTELAGGACGDNMSWTLYEDGLLEITGAGSMYDFKSSGIPWKAYKSRILEIRVGQGVTHIGSWAFYGCKYAAEIDLPKGLISVGDNAFVNCAAMESLLMPDTVTTLGSNVFGGCTALTALELPAGLTSVGSYLFKECTGLTTVTVPAGVTALQGHTFCGCKGLENVYLPAGLTEIGELEFEGCYSLKGIWVDGENSVFASDENGVLFTEDGAVLLACPGGYVGSYEIPAAVTEIAANAFDGCLKLTAVLLPDSVCTIGTNAFSRCESLTRINIPDGITQIPRGMLSGCKSLPEVTLPESVEVIGIGAFMGCESLTELVLPDSVHTIGSTAFGECYKLQEMVIPHGVTSIEMQLFRDCQAMESVTIPDSVQQIGDTAFLHCHSLKHVTIPDGVTEIPYGAFMRCYGLESVDIPDSVTVIGINAFYECESLLRADIPAGVTRIEDYTFFRCFDLEEVELPDGITEIDQYAFYGCYALKSVDLPDALETIGTYAFGYTAMTEVELPGSVTKIADYAFINDYIDTIRFLGSAPEFGECSLGGLTADAYYPMGDASWTPEVMLDYGGDITWAGYDDGRIYRVDYTRASLSLEGDIGLNFYAQLSDDLAAEESAYLEFRMNGTVQRIPVYMVPGNDGVYRFSCAVPAKGMTDLVTAQMYTASGPVGAPKTYSVRQYCHDLFEYAEENGMTGNEDQVELMKALLNYGAYSQIGLNYRTDDLANAGLAAEEKILPGSVDAAAWAHQISGSEEGIQLVSASLLLEAKTTVRIYFRLTGEKEIEDYTFLADGKTVRPQASGGQYFIELSDIVAKDLDRMYTVNLGSISIDYSGLSYVNQIMNWSAAPENMVDTAKALYVYAMAANAFFES